MIIDSDDVIDKIYNEATPNKLESELKSTKKA